MKIDMKILPKVFLTHKKLEIGVFLILIELIGAAVALGRTSDSIDVLTLSNKVSMPSAKTLRDAYLSALDRSETVNIQKELLDQAGEIDAQAKGALFPTISGSFSYLRQPSPVNATGMSVSPSEQSTGKITAAQPIFRGFRDFAALRQKKFLVGAQRQSLLNAARQLFYDVSTAYYNASSLERDEQNYLIEIEVNRKRLKELDSFFKIGRSQLTDVLTFQSNIASLEAQLESTRGQLESAKDVLAYLTGWRRNFILQDNENPPLALGDVSTYVARINDRADVKLAVANAQASEEGVPIAFGQHFPSVDLIGNYYFDRPGVLNDVHWDLSLALTLPIFQGGVIQSQVRQAQSVARQYNLLHSQTLRLAEQEVRTFYDAVDADGKQVSKLKNLVEIAKKNADTEVKYYRNGLVTNLDVFQAITTHQEAKRQLDHQTYMMKLDYVKLQAATGLRPEMMIKISEKP